jgi:hypothetical protein
MYLAAVLAWALPLLWSLVEKLIARANFVKATFAPAGTSEDVIKHDMQAPSLVEMSRKVGAWIVVLALAGSITACGARPTRNGERIAPEAEAALQLERGIDALNALTVPAGVSPVERLVDAQVLTRDEAIVVATGIRDAMGIAKNVSLALGASLAARTDAEKVLGMQRAAVFLRSLSDKLAALPITIGTEKGRRAVVDLLKFAGNLLLTAGSIFPAPLPEGPPPSLADALAF